jgi:hypothetical protein
LIHLKFLLLGARVLSLQFSVRAVQRNGQRFQLRFSE